MKTVFGEPEKEGKDSMAVLMHADEGLGEDEISVVVERSHLAASYAAQKLKVTTITDTDGQMKLDIGFEPVKLADIEMSTNLSDLASLYDVSNNVGADAGGSSKADKEAEAPEIDSVLAGLEAALTAAVEEQTKKDEAHSAAAKVLLKLKLH